MRSFVLLIEMSLKFIPNGLIDSVGLGNGLALKRRQAITWTNVAPIHWRKYAALEGEELMCFQFNIIFQVLHNPCYTI